MSAPGRSRRAEIGIDENAQDAARREFREETGFAVTGALEPLGEILQRGGKRVIAFACEADLDVEAIRSNTFEIEWPPNSGKRATFPEIDRAGWFDLTQARSNMLEGQRRLLDQLAGHRSRQP